MTSIAAEQLATAAEPPNGRLRNSFSFFLSFFLLCPAIFPSLFRSIFLSEHVGVVATVQICILDVPSSNLGRLIG